MSIDVPQTSYFPAVVKSPSDYEILTGSSLANGPISDLASRTLFLLNQQAYAPYKRVRYSNWTYVGTARSSKQFKDAWAQTISEPLGLNTDYIRVVGTLNYAIKVGLNNSLPYPNRVVVNSSISISTGGSTTIDMLTAQTQYITDGESQDSALLSQYIQGSRLIDCYLGGNPNGAVITLTQTYNYPDRRWPASMFSQNDGQGSYVATQPSVMIEVYRN